MVGGFAMLVTKCGYRRKSRAGVLAAEGGTAEQPWLADEHNEILIDASTFRFDDEGWAPWQVNGGSPAAKIHRPASAAPMRAGVHSVEAVARVLPDR